ncbi:MAG: tripartite tricarboxylate transporter TctB family protein [Burkholderiaceae bacterium]|nr:tripartite tricarboxylate transporter TctB family protein [Burkholderiaceae bacterium]
MNSDTADPGSPAGIKTWVVELTVALGLFVLGAVVGYNSWLLGAGWRDDGPGAGYFPFYIGLLICISSAVVGYGAIKHAKGSGKVFVTYPQLRLVMTVLLPSLAFVIGVQLLGIYVGSFLFIAGFMIWVGKYHWAKSGTIAFAVMAVAFLMFEVWFKVPLFKGALAPLRFLGY